MFDKDTARLAINEMRKKGIEFSEGLSLQEINEVESALGAPMPTDLKMLLMEGVPIGGKDGGSFPNWHINPQKIIAEDRLSIEEAFIFDIKENGYWHESFGERPRDVEAAKDLAISAIRAWPPLIRVYGHRYMPTIPSVDGPVFSVAQAVDTIYYGNNLASYLEKEFGIELPGETPESPLEVPYWASAFDL